MEALAEYNCKAGIECRVYLMEGLGEDLIVPEHHAVYNADKSTT